jgi:hypothetical protein
MVLSVQSADLGRDVDVIDRIWCVTCLLFWEWNWIICYSSPGTNCLHCRKLTFDLGRSLRQLLIFKGKCYNITNEALIGLLFLPGCHFLQIVYACYNSCTNQDFVRIIYEYDQTAIPWILYQSFTNTIGPPSLGSRSDRGESPTRLMTLTQVLCTTCSLHCMLCIQHTRLRLMDKYLDPEP